MLLLAVASLATLDGRWESPDEEAVGPSPLALITQLQHRYRDWDKHPQRYHGGRRRLTPENTAPMRIALDFKSLFEDTAPPHSACFRIGAWYRRGLPIVTPAGSDPHPPADASLATCTRTSTSSGNSDCWGICEGQDVITNSGRDKLIAVVTRIAQAPL